MVFSSLAIFFLQAEIPPPLFTGAWLPVCWSVHQCLVLFLHDTYHTDGGMEFMENISYELFTAIASARSSLTIYIPISVFPGRTLIKTLENFRKVAWAVKTA